MYYFIVNESGGSGRAKKTWHSVKTILRSRGISYKAFRTEYAGHACSLAYSISSLSDKDIKLIVVGGDGTINEVINGINDLSKIKLGIIPTGSGNDFARGFNIPKNATMALDRILAGDEGGYVDIGRIDLDNGNSRYFGISSGIGLDAIVCKKALHSKQKALLNRLGMGKLTYLLLTIETVFSMKYTNAFIKTDKFIKQLNGLIFFSSMNMKAEGGGVPIAPNASFDDGKLSLCSAYGIKKTKAFCYLPFLAKGKHEKFKNVFCSDANYVDIKLDSPMTVHADGEYLGEHNHIYVECLHKALQIL